MGLIKRLFDSFFDLFDFENSLHKSQKIGDLRLVSCLDQATAREAINHEGTVALIGTKNNYKWVQMKCPCGCGETIALNLMPTHKPRWKIDVKNFSIYPSVHSMTCGAHYWIKNGTIVWSYE